MYRILIVSTAVALSLSTSHAPAQAQAGTSSRSGPMAFDVAGVKLGASPAEVKAALQRAGYVIDYLGTAKTLEQETRFEAGQRLGRKPQWPKDAGVSNIESHGPHQESASIHFIQQPGGSAVSSITVHVPGSAMSQGAFRSQVLAKYGKPDASHFQGAEMVWCAAEAHAVCGRSFVASGHLDTDYPKLSVGSGANGGNIDLQIGQLAFDQADRDKEAAIERLAPKTLHGAF